jgi:hypothetical protein
MSSRHPKLPPIVLFQSVALGKITLLDSCIYPIFCGPLSETLSSSGPGHRPFTAVTRVRIPLGSLLCKTSGSA